MREFLVSLSEVNSDIIFDRFQCSGARFQWKQFRNLYMLLKRKHVMLDCLTNTTSEIQQIENFQNIFIDLLEVKILICYKFYKYPSELTLK